MGLFDKNPEKDNEYLLFKIKQLTTENESLKIQLTNRNTAKDKLYAVIDIAFLKLNDYLENDCQNDDFVVFAYETLLTKTTLKEVSLSERGKIRSKLRANFV